MKKSILVTGVSGTGKTSLSEKLQTMGYETYDMDSYPGLFEMLDKRTGMPMSDQNNDDLEMVQAMDWVCDINLLKKIISNQKNDIAFYFGNAGNIDEVLPFFDKIILLQVHEDAMRHRLTTRTENDFGRTTEIQDFILSSKDTWETAIKEKGAVTIDANQPLDQVAQEIINNI